MSDNGAKNFIELTASIVSAYVGNNPTPAADIPNLISQTGDVLEDSETQSGLFVFRIKKAGA